MGGLLSLCAGGYYIYKQSSRSSSPSTNDDDNINNDVVDEENRSDDLVLELCKGALGSTKLPTDSVKAGSVLENATSGHLVHVMQDRKNGRSMLSLLFEIPTSALSTKGKYADGGTNILDFTRSLRNWDREENRILTDRCFIGTALQILEGDSNELLAGSSKIAYGYYQYLYKGQSTISLCPLDRRIYQDSPIYEGRTKDFEFVQDFKSKQSKEAFFIKRDSSDPDVQDLCLFDVFYAIKMSFWIKEDESQKGVDAQNGLKLLEEIYNFEIEGRTGSYMYDKFLFYQADRGIGEDVTVYSDKNGETLPLFE